MERGDWGGLTESSRENFHQVKNVNYPEDHGKWQTLMIKPEKKYGQTHVFGKFSGKASEW